MKSNNKDIYNELGKIVYTKIVDEQLTGLFLECKPLMSLVEILNYLEENINSYLSEDELEQLYINYSSLEYTDELREIIIKFALADLALKINIAIESALKNKNFVGDNPFDPLINPYAFMISKYYNEELGVKLDFIDSGLNAPF